MKKLIYIILAIAVVAGIVLFVQGCTQDPITKQDVEGAITVTDTERFISVADYNVLKETYMENTNGEGTQEGFDLLLQKILSDNEEEWGNVEIKTPEAEKPVLVNVYFDNTSSMKGFFERKGKNATSSVSDFVAVFNKMRDLLGDTVRSYYVDKTGFKESTLKEITGQINNKEVEARDAFLMDALLDNIVSSITEDSSHDVMAYFVTDGIMSGTNEEIRRNPRHNIDHAETLSTNIANVLKKLEDRNYGVAVLQFFALFDGNYINYHNGNEPVEKQSRPFYLVVVGPVKDINNLDKRMREDKLFGSPRRLVAATKAGMPKLSVLCNNEMCDEEYGVIKVVSEKEVPTVDLNFSLENMPEYLRDSLTAKKAMEVKLDGEILSLKDATYDEKSSSLTLKRNLVGSKSDYKLEVRVRNVLPVWVENSTSHNDDPVKDQLDKTFNLDWLMKGLVKGIYNNSADEYISEKAEYTITKE